MEKLSTPASWQEAFESYKIPVIRTIEEQLRVGVSRDKERLRDLVGGNYRDLLSTADEIILLATKTRTAEGQISEIGQQCEPSQKHIQNRTLPIPASLATQAHCLSKCVVRGAGALRKGQILLSAKLLVISRLLIKSLSESDEALQVIEQLRGKATSLRRQLLRRIDIELRNPRSTTKASVDAICAYCLVTSSSSSDALKHFQQLRLERLRQRLSGEIHGASHIKETFQYLISTIQSLQTLLGRAVNDPINSLQQHPILEDPSITQLESIGIDQTQKLIPVDITSFTPYIKRVVLRRDEIRSVVEGWTAGACEVFSKGLIGVFSKIKAVSEVTSLRKDLLGILLPVYFSTYAQKSLLDAIRQATSARLLELNHRQIETLAKIGHDMAGSTISQVAISSPWETSFVQTSLVTQSETYLHQLHDRHLGTKGDLDRNIKRLKTWARQSAQLQKHVHSLRSIRWQDVIEEADEEDEEDATTITSHLTNDDPRRLHDSIEHSLKVAVLEFENVVKQTVNDALEPASIDVQRVVYLIRLIRESAPAVSGIVPEIQSRNLELFAKLHLALASDVIRRLSLKYEAESSPKLIFEHLPEDLPSPLTISFLHDTCSIMLEIGGIDIWSQSAVSLLKNALRERILAGEHSTVYTQNDFDTAYLQAALKTADVSDQDKTISTKAAATYWNRTRLLFGILN